MFIKTFKLELNHLSLPLLVSAQFEMFTSLESDLRAELAVCAFQSEDDLFSSLSLKIKQYTLITPRVRRLKLTSKHLTNHNGGPCRSDNDSYLFPENGLRLTAIALLFAIVTPTALGCQSFLGLFVLGNLVRLVYLAFFAEGTTLFGYVHLQ